MLKRLALSCVVALPFVLLVSRVYANDDIPKAAWKRPIGAPPPKTRARKSPRSTLPISTTASGKAPRSVDSAPAPFLAPIAATSRAGT